MASDKRVGTGLAAMIVIFAIAGCTGQDRLPVWPFAPEGPPQELAPTDTASSWVDVADTPQPKSSAVRKASAEQPLDPPTGGAAQTGGEVIYSDPLLQPAHVLR